MRLSHQFGNKIKKKKNTALSLFALCSFNITCLETQSFTVNVAMVLCVVLVPFYWRSFSNNSIFVFFQRSRCNGNCGNGHEG